MNNLILKDIPAGYGKTYDELKYHFNSMKTIYVVPSISVANRYYNTIAKSHTIKTIHSETVHDSNVLDSVTNHIKDSNESVIITFNSMLRLDYEYVEKYNWDMVIDDPIIELQEHTLAFDDIFPYHKYIDIDENNKVTPNEEIRYDTTFPNSMYCDFLFTSRLGKYDYYLTEMNEEENRTFVNMAMIPTRKALPDTNIKLIGAGVTERLYVKMYGHHFNITKERLTEERDMPKKNITIHYFDENNNTRYRKDKSPEAYQNRINHLKKHVGKSLILKNRYDNWKLPSNWQSIPPNCHSSNDYMDYDNIIITMSMNMKMSAQNVISKKCNVSSKYIFNQRTASVYYQACMRTSLRDNDSDDPVNIYVMDKRSADYLADQFESNHGHDVEVKKIEGFDTEDQRQYNYGRYVGIWDTPSEQVKAANMLIRAKKGYYTPEENRKIVLLADNKKRQKLKEMPLWDKVTCQGNYRKR